jgi:hypothetical protein
MDGEQRRQQPQQSDVASSLLKLHEGWHRVIQACRACQRAIAPHGQCCAHGGVRLATHCPGCGNPLPPAGAPACPACGVALLPVQLCDVGSCGAPIRGKIHEGGPSIPHRSHITLLLLCTEAATIDQVTEADDNHWTVTHGAGA